MPKFAAASLLALCAAASPALGADACARPAPSCAVPAPALCFAPGTPLDYVAETQRRAREISLAVTDRDDFRAGDFDRWASTASGGGLSQGDPTTLTWSYLKEGTSIDGFANEPTSASNLMTFLNGLYGNPSVWHAHFVSVFERWGQLTGNTYVYEPNDDGAVFPNSPGQLGVRGDVRIGGHLIDDNFGILAYNFFPDFGDMVIDTADSFYDTTTSNSLRLRNVLSHEHGHGLGLSHVCPINETKLMEPFATVDFDGPQHDDTLAGNRLYGDAYENNDSAGAATPLAGAGAGVDLGGSVDDNQDQDWYRFFAPANGSVSVTLTPVGFTYLEGAQNQDGSCSAGTTYNTLTRQNLGFDIVAPNGTTWLASLNSQPAGSPESISNFVLNSGAGDYYVVVYGNAVDFAQLYTLFVDRDGGTTIPQFVERFYTEVLGRASEPSGQAFWESYLADNCNAEGLRTISLAFLDSEEFRTVRPVTINGLVNILYRTFLGRDADSGGLAFWGDRIRDARLGVALQGFIGSAEFQGLLPNRTDANAVRDVVTRLYQEVLDRDPDQGGLDFWTNYIVTTQDLEGASSNGFLASAEFEARALTYSQYIGILYRAFLGREPDAGGVSFWESVLRSDTISNVSNGFVPSPEFQELFADVCGG